MVAIPHDIQYDDRHDAILGDEWRQERHCLLPDMAQSTIPKAGIQEEVALGGGVLLRLPKAFFRH